MKNWHTVFGIFSWQYDPNSWHTPVYSSYGSSPPPRAPLFHQSLSNKQDQGHWRQNSTSGVVSTVEGVQYSGDIMINVVDILNTVGVFSTVGISWVPWGYLEYCGGTQYREGCHDARGGYREYRGGCSVLLGESFVIWIPPRYSRYPPTCIMISPYGTGHLHGTTQAPR